MSIFQLGTQSTRRRSMYCRPAHTDLRKCSSGVPSTRRTIAVGLPVVAVHATASADND